MHLRKTAPVLAALAVLLTTSACGTAGTSAAAPQQVATTSSTAAIPVIEVRIVQAGEAGVTGQVRAVLYADGTLLRSNAGSQWSSTALEPPVVAALLDQADDSGLLADTVDLGGGRLTDSPWSELRITTEGRVHELRLEAPELLDGLNSEQLAARTSFQGLVDALLRTGDDRPWTPERALAWVEDGNLLDFEFPPPLWTGTLALHPLSGCVEPEGDDLALLDELLEADGSTRTGTDRSIALRTDEGNTVRLRVRDLLPHDPGCP